MIGLPWGQLCGTSQNVRSLDDAELAAQPVPGTILVGAGELQAGHRGDGGQGLAAEAKAQVVGAADLASGVAFQSQVEVVPAHTASVLRDFQQALAAVRRAPAAIWLGIWSDSTRILGMQTL